MAEDAGWAGKWEPNILSAGCLDELREKAGEPVLTRNGRPIKTCTVNLETGELTYPARGGR